jgi:hypothetical protein
MKVASPRKSAGRKARTKPLSEAMRKVVAVASRLSKNDQDALAEWLLAELSDEKRWQKAFAGSQGSLMQLGNEALAEYRAGRTKVLRSPDL